MEQIRTKWHKITPILNSGEIYCSAPATPNGKAELASTFAFNVDEFKATLKRMDALPKFVIERELLTIASDSEYQKSLMDLKRAKMMKLPYPEMIVEYQSVRGCHTIVYLCEPTEEESCDFVGHRTSIDFDEHGEYLVVSPTLTGLTIADKAGEIWVRMEAMEVQFYKSIPTSLVQDIYAKEAGSIFHAAAAIYLLMGTNGVERKMIDTERINRKRSTSGKPAIPRHTYIYIGRVYKSEQGDASTEYIPRKSPRPHWRRGHNRTVRIGAGRNQLKSVWIKPRLVSYHPRDQEPVKPKYHVKVNQTEK